MNIDLLIYLQKFSDAINEFISEDKSIYTDMGIDDIDLFLNLLNSEIALIAEQNLIEHDDPTLSEPQYKECHGIAIAQYHLQNLEKLKLIESQFDIDSMETKYKLTELGKDYLEHMNGNERS
jgi:hypothetical protein